LTGPLLRFSVSQLSRVGGRNNNEDRAGYSRTAESLLLVVADGMGGHLYGEMAAEAAVQSLTDAFQQEAGPRLVDPVAFLEQGLLAAHRVIVERAFADRLPDIPGTTCVACVVQDGTALWAHAGDSRLYLVRGGRVLERTRDHSLARELAEMGNLSEEAAALLPGRNVIYSCLGGYRRPQVEVSRPVRLERGDTLLLCSDGLWGPLTDHEIARAMAGTAVAPALVELAELAQTRAGAESDNVTGLALGWGVHDAKSHPAPAGSTVIAGIGGV
jgi:PPM family protein phosphatase